MLTQFVYSGTRRTVTVEHGGAVDFLHSISVRDGIACPSFNVRSVAELNDLARYIYRSANGADGRPDDVAPVFQLLEIMTGI